MKKAFILSVALALGISLAACGTASQKTKFSQTTLDAGFDTAFTLIGYCRSQSEFDGYFSAMTSLFQGYNQLFDRYNSYDGVNNIKTINDQAGIAPVKVDPAILSMLSLSEQMYELTGGAFDITLGSVLAIWHDYREKGIAANGEGDLNPAVPTLAELTAAYVPDAWSHVQIDEAAQTVYIDDPTVSLDVGGVAKGYASELVAQQLEASGLTQGAINGGGNVRLIGSKPDGSKWAIGVTEPDNTAANVGTFYNAEPLAYVTSGDYQRYYVSGGQTYSHITDPKTLFPAAYFRSVTIVAKDSGAADCLSTALFVEDQASGQAILDRYNAANGTAAGAYWVYASANNPGGGAKEVDGYWVSASPNLQEYLDAYGAAK